jgi:hypothetical protein
MSRLVPEDSGTVIATDPASSYFVLPTANRTLTMTTWHIGGRSELEPARSGYLLMHRLYMGDHWREAAREMWRLGVRYIVVNRGFRMQSPTLDLFSGFHAPYIVRSWEQQDEIDTYMRRVEQVATLVNTIEEYYAYRLEPRLLFGEKA